MTLLTPEQAWRAEHPLEAALKLLREGAADPFTPVALLTAWECQALLDMLAELEDECF